MRVYHGGESVPDVQRGVGLGNFDGIHAGHAALLRRLQAACRERGIRSMVYTFENHPDRVLLPQKETPLIITNDQKVRLMEPYGIDELYFERFDAAYASTETDVFAEKILAEKLHAALVVVGHNYSFGKFGRGDPALLTQLGARYGFEVLVIPPVTKRLGTDPGEETAVSSTMLRGLIAKGRMADYFTMTGRYYSIPGQVVEGRRVGRSLGFPTANILPRAGFALPGFGVYATLTRKDGRLYRSVTNIGDNPTFAEVHRVTIETHILDFDGGLYGADIEVYFLRKQRGECKFSGPAALTEQLRRDVEERRRMGDVPELPEESPELQAGSPELPGQKGY